MTENNNFSPLDIAIMIAYVVGIVMFGIWIGTRKKGSTGDRAYFLAGGTLKWPVIGLALFSTNISTIHLISLAQEGYINGLAYGNFEWMAITTLIILSLFFAPFYIRSRVTTLPDFLEKRYSKHSRNWLAVLSIVSAIFIHIGFSLYTGAIVLEGIFGLQDAGLEFLGIRVPLRILLIAMTASVIGLYTIIGGLKSVVYTESIETIVLILGSVIITVTGYRFAGGWEGISSTVEPVKLTLLRPSGDPSGLPWYSVLLGYPVIGIWYWCADQTIVQRVLGAKNEFHARTAPLFTGFLKILPVFIFVLPGLICYALVKNGVLPGPADPGGSDTLMHMISQLLPVGMKGIVAAALIAALMGTVAGALNSIATLFSYDIYRPMNPRASHEKLVRVGRIVTFIAMILAICWSPLLAHYKSIFQGISTLISYIAPPITAVFILGIFWKGASATGSRITLYAGSVIGLLVFLVDWNREADWLAWLHYDIPFLLMSFYLFVFCSVILVITSGLYPQAHSEESLKLVWDRPLRNMKLAGRKEYTIYRAALILLLAVFILLYVLFV